MNTLRQEFCDEINTPMVNTFKIKHNIGNLIDRIDKIVVKNNELIIYYSDKKDDKQIIVAGAKSWHDEITVVF